MKGNILFFLVIGCIVISAQDRNIDSLRLEQKYKMLFYNHEIVNFPLYSFGEITDPFASPFESEFLNFNGGQISELNQASIERIKNDINKSFVIYRKGQNKYYLGVVSDVLGYVSTAAAAGIAAYHVYKYRKEYGLK